MKNLIVFIMTMILLVACGSDDGMIKKAKWERVEMPIEEYFNDIHFLSNNVGYILNGYSLSDRKTRVLKTTDGGGIMVNNICFRT